jgi:hypothetical protein
LILKKTTLSAIVLIAIVILLSELSFTQAANWQTVTTINGSADQTTQVFYIASSQWRISWSYTPDPDYPEYSAIYFFVYPQGETVSYIDEVSVTEGNPTSGTEYIYQGQGSFYLKIISANIPEYSLAIQQDLGPTNTPFRTGSPTPSIQGTVNNNLLVIGLIAIVIVVVVVFMIARRRPKKTLPLPPPPPPP